MKKPPHTLQITKKDKTVIAFLYQALPKEQLLQIKKHKTAKAIWDALKTRHIGEERVQQARLQTLKSDFEMLHMKEDETIDTFTAKLTTLVNKAASLGHTIEDSIVVRKLLNVVPDRFLQIVASIEQYSDLDEMSVDEAIGRLKTFEERLKSKKEIRVDSQESLMFTRHEGQGKPFRERGRGRFNQSRGQENNRFRSERKNWESSQNNFKKETDSNSNKFTHDKSKVLCFKCKEYGHFANKCPSKKEEQSNLIEEDLEPTLLMATVEEAPGRVGSENLDGGVTESMSRPGIKEDIYAARTPIGRQSVGSITNQKHDQSGFMIDHNNEGGSNQKNMINLDLRKITTVKVEVTEEKLIYQDAVMVASKKSLVQRKGLLDITHEILERKKKKKNIKKNDLPGCKDDTSTTRNKAVVAQYGGFNQKNGSRRLTGTHDKAIVMKVENDWVNSNCWRTKHLQYSYS
ncbi:zinc finger, CCHC-type containing protein [Tanacetum coccineum]